MNKNTQILIGLVLLAAIVALIIWFPQSSSQSTITYETAPGQLETEILNNPENQSTDYASLLISSSWTWKETIMSDDTIIKPQQADKFVITFTNEGTISGTTDCNSFFGTYTLNENQLGFGPLASTLMFCEGSQESIFTKQFENIDQIFFTESGDLVLLLKYDSGSVMFTKTVKN